MKMKKRIALIISICILLFSSIVFAKTNFNVKFESSNQVIKAGDKVEVALKIEGFSENDKGINVLLGTLEYDKAVFEVLKVENMSSIQYWGTPTYNPANGKLLLDSHTFVNVPHNALKITLTAKKQIEDVSSTQIKLKGIQASDGENDLNVEDAVLNFQVEKLVDNNLDSKDINSKTIIMISAILGVFIVGLGIIIFIKKKK